MGIRVLKGTRRRAHVADHNGVPLKSMEVILGGEVKSQK